MTKFESCKDYSHVHTQLCVLPFCRNLLSLGHIFQQKSPEQTELSERRKQTNQGTERNFNVKKIPIKLRSILILKSILA